MNNTLIQNGFIHAPLWKRSLALVVDVIILYLIFLVLLVLLFCVGAFENHKNASVGLMVLYHASYTVPIALLLFKDVPNGQSIGKRVLKLYVRDAYDAATVPTSFRLVLRNLFLCLTVVEGVVLLFNRDNRRIGDFAARTVVVVSGVAIADDARIAKRIRRLKHWAIIALVACTLYISFTLILRTTDIFATAEEYLEANPNEFPELGGTMRSCWVVSGSASWSSLEGKADYKLWVIGAKKSLLIDMSLEKHNGLWEVKSVDR